MPKEIYRLELWRLLQRRQAVWWQLLVQAIALVVYLLIYQFPLHTNSNPNAFLYLISLLSVWLFPLFVVNDWQLSARYGRDTLLAQLPLAPMQWVMARLFAWLSLQSLHVVLWLIVVWLGSYWFFVDAGLMLLALLQLVVVSTWVISLSFAMSLWVKRSWLALLGVYAMIFIFMGSGLLATLLFERFPSMANVIEFFSYGYRVANFQRGMISLADMSFWALAIALNLWLVNIMMQKLANYSPSPWLTSWHKWLSVAVAGVLLWLPIELDATLAGLYRPSLVVKEQVKQIKNPLYVERLISWPLNQLSYERWLMRRLYGYQRLHKAIYVQQQQVEQAQALQLGLTVVADLAARSQFAGLWFNYGSLATQEAQWRDITLLDETMVLALRRVMEVPNKRILIIVDETQNIEDFSLLAKELAREFTIDWLVPSMFDWLVHMEAEAYLVLGGHSLQAEHWNYLEQERRLGRGLWINSMGVRISSLSEYPPMRLETSALDDYLATKGMRLGRNLLQDPDGYMLADNGIVNNYPLWLSGRMAANSLLANALVGAAPLMSVALFTQPKSDWQPLIYSSRLAREQRGNIELNFLQIWHQSMLEEGQQYLLASLYKGLAGEGDVVLFGSTTWLSNMLQDAYTYQNLAKAKAVARYMVGDEGLVKGQVRFNILYEMRKPFAVHEMTYRYLWVIGALISCWVLLGIMIEIVVRRGKK